MQLQNWMKVFSVTISRMKPRFVSGQVRPSLCSTSHCGADKEGVSTELNARGSLLAAGMRQLPHLSLCSFCGSSHTFKLKLWHLMQAASSIKGKIPISLRCVRSFFAVFLGFIFFCRPEWTRWGQILTNCCFDVRNQQDFAALTTAALAQAATAHLFPVHPNKKWIVWYIKSHCRILKE